MSVTFDEYFNIRRVVPSLLEKIFPSALVPLIIDYLYIWDTTLEVAQAWFHAETQNNRWYGYAPYAHGTGALILSFEVPQAQVSIVLRGCEPSNQELLTLTSQQIRQEVDGSHEDSHVTSELHIEIHPSGSGINFNFDIAALNFSGNKKLKFTGVRDLSKIVCPFYWNDDLKELEFIRLPPL